MFDPGRDADRQSPFRGVAVRGERYTATIVDAGNPTAFIRAGELNLRGDELPAEFDKDTATRSKLEAIRRKVGELMGIPVSQSIPKFPSSPLLGIFGR
jgi:2-methylaconitate cis-trans-isomerase PrpF